VKDFCAIGLVAPPNSRWSPIPPSVPRRCPELIDIIKKRPGALSFGSSAAGTPHHLYMAMFLSMIGGLAQHVPYRGSVPALTD